MQPFYKMVPALHLNIFEPNVFIRRNLPEIQNTTPCILLSRLKFRFDGKENFLTELPKH